MRKGVKEKKVNELKNICKQNKIKCVVGVKKDEIIYQILLYNSTNMIFRLNEIQNETEKEETVVKPEAISLIEQLEKNRTR
jgi:hypothetical protein